MIDERLMFRVQRDISTFGFQVALVGEAAHEQFTLAEPLIMRSTERNEQIKPFGTFTHETMQGLMNELWNAGLRPSNYHGSGQTESMAGHIEDLRKISFKLLDITGN